jgi:hypothetical protein
VERVCTRTCEACGQKNGVGLYSVEHVDKATIFSFYRALGNAILFVEPVDNAMRGSFCGACVCSVYCCESIFCGVYGMVLL